MWLKQLKKNPKHKNPNNFKPFFSTHGSEIKYEISFQADFPSGSQKVRNRLKAFNQWTYLSLKQLALELCFLP